MPVRSCCHSPLHPTCTAEPMPRPLPVLPSWAGPRCGTPSSCPGEVTWGAVALWGTRCPPASARSQVGSLSSGGGCKHSTPFSFLDQIPHCSSEGQNLGFALFQGCREGGHHQLGSHRTLKIVMSCWGGSLSLEAGSVALLRHPAPHLSRDRSGRAQRCRLGTNWDRR